MKKILLLLLVGVFLIVSTSAFIDLGFKAKESCVQIQQICTSCSYVNISTITFPNSTIINLNTQMTQNDINYNYTFCGTNKVGVYYFNVKGDKGGIVSSEDGKFEINGIGQELTSSKSLVYIILIVTLILFFILIIYFMAKLGEDNETNNEGEIISIGKLKYLKSTLLFVDWLILVALLYLISNLAFAYLGEQLFANILFKLFQVSMGLTFPIIIIWFIWIFVQIIQDKKARGLIEKGIYPRGRF